MSTRAVITVQDTYQRFHIYTHCDGYPSHTAKRLVNAERFAFLDRYDAGDFAAAIIAGNADEKRYMKAGRCLSQGGNLYLTNHYQDHSDLEFRYKIIDQSGKFKVVAYEIATGKWKKIFSGNLAEFDAFATLLPA